MVSADDATDKDIYRPHHRLKLPSNPDGRAETLPRPRFARAFFTLVEALGVCNWDRARTAGAAEAHSAATDAKALTVAPPIAESYGA